MNARIDGKTGFRRQIVFRLDAEQWPLLESATAEHGSIQAAVLAGLRAIGAKVADTELPSPQAEGPSAGPATKPKPRREAKPAKAKHAQPSANETTLVAPAATDEISAREAAQLLGLKTGTVSGYIRSGRLPGRYDGEPTWRGWFTTSAAVDGYAKRRR